MTSTPSILLLKRSGQSSDRPSGTVVQNGELAIAVGAADPGLYFEDSAGAIRKIGPTHYGTTAPNSTPVGLAGNSVGELWADSSTADTFLKVWDGAAWTTVGAGTALTANYANSAGSAVIASGAASAQTCVLASGALVASGAITAQTCLLASGAIFASGAVTAQTSTLSSGAVLSSGTVAAAYVYASGLPNPASNPSGYLAYLVETSGAYPSGLYVRAANAWILT